MRSDVSFPALRAHPLPRFRGRLNPQGGEPPDWMENIRLELSKTDEFYPGKLTTLEEARALQQKALDRVHDSEISANLERLAGNEPRLKEGVRQLDTVFGILKGKTALPENHSAIRRLLREQIPVLSRNGDFSGALERVRFLLEQPDLARGTFPKERAGLELQALELTWRSLLSQSEPPDPPDDLKRHFKNAAEAYGSRTYATKGRFADTDFARKLLGFFPKLPFPEADIQTVKPNELNVQLTPLFRALEQSLAEKPDAGTAGVLSDALSALAEIYERKSELPQQSLYRAEAVDLRSKSAWLRAKFKLKNPFSLGEGDSPPDL